MRGCDRVAFDVRPSVWTPGGRTQAARQLRSSVAQASRDVRASVAHATRAARASVYVVRSRHRRRCAVRTLHTCVRS
jgi:hypothetical protein